MLQLAATRGGCRLAVGVFECSDFITHNLMGAKCAMSTGGVYTAESATLTAEDASAYAERAAPNINARRSCIALLTPYNGGNLGDASILDAGRQHWP
jgi:hypothetical protein